MNTTQRLLDLQPPTLLRLGEIDRLIRTRRLIVPPPSRHKLIALCEDGTFETPPRPSTRSPYLVTEESFLRWVESLSGKVASALG